MRGGLWEGVNGWGGSGRGTGRRGAGLVGGVLAECDVCSGRNGREVCSMSPVEQTGWFVGGGKMEGETNDQGSGSIKWKGNG